MEESVSKPPPLLFGMVVMRLAALFTPIGHLPPFNFESQPVRSFLPSHTFLRTFNGKRIIFNLISLNPFDFKDYVTQWEEKFYMIRLWRISYC